MNSLEYPYDEHPSPGETVEVAPGVRWLTMPMGGSLNHINLYLLEDSDGWWVVDTGLPLPNVTELWHEIFARELGGKPVKAVICTHMHPDHVGQAGAITEHFECPLYMTRAEYFQARTFSSGGPGFHSSWLGREFYVRAGMPADYLDDLRRQWQHRPGAGPPVPELPGGYRRLRDGDVLTIGSRHWHIVVG
jgi:glyoxylase-like metal-dependent hydrolase (beta-lactamase superfamily II)